MERTVELHFPADHPVGPGHFPANPILPGALLLDAVIEVVLERSVQAGGATIRSAKFFRPIRPGERLALQWQPAQAGAIGFECRVAGEDRPAFSGTLAIGPADGSTHG